MLNDFQSGHRAHGDNLLCAFDGVHHHVAAEILGNALPYQQKSADDRERNQNTGSNPDQVNKEVAHIVLGFSRKAPNKGDAGGIAGRRRNKHHKGDDQHLR